MYRTINLSPPLIIYSWRNKGTKADLKYKQKVWKNNKLNPAIGHNTLSHTEKVNPNPSEAANALSDIFGGLRLQTAGEDYDEEAFARKMKKGQGVGRDRRTISRILTAVLQRSDEGAQLQIGITATKTKRLSRRRKGVPFGLIIIL